MPNGLGEAGSVTFHSRTVSSALPAASVFPSGLNATDCTYPFAPVSGLPNGLGEAGSVTFHSRTVSSALPAASVFPSGLNATEYTVLAGPVSRASRTG